MNSVALSSQNQNNDFITVTIINFILFTYYLNFNVKIIRISYLSTKSLFMNTIHI